MTEVAHTPGPWRALADHSVKSYAPGHWSVATCGGRRGEANARLISAALDLLEALQAMVEGEVNYMVINHLGDAETQHNVKRARAAISKALGAA